MFNIFKKQITNEYLLYKSIIGKRDCTIKLKERYFYPRGLSGSMWQELRIRNIEIEWVKE